MFELLALAIALLGTLAAGAWDLKTTDIPDRLVFAMIAAGFLFGGAEGLITGDWTVLITTGIVSAAFAAFALAMYYAGAWGGGDGALLVAVGSLLPIWPIASPLGFLPFPLLYFFSLFLVGLFYSAFYTALLLRRNRAARALFRKNLSAVRLAYVPLVILLLLFLWLITSPLSMALAIFFLLVPPIYALSAVSEKVFYRRIPTRALRPGDMIGEDIPKLRLYKRKIRGLTQKEVSAIRKTKKSVLIRSGVRYGIVFFLSLAALLLFSALL